MTPILAALLAGAAAWLAYRPGRHPIVITPVMRRLIVMARGRLVTRRRRVAARARVREAITEVVADVRAGQPPERALERALSERDVAPRTLSALRIGGDVIESLRADARRSTQPVLASVAACWSVAATRGAGLGDALDRLVVQERRAEEVRRQLAAHLAAPRATARMLALLPAFGLGLGLVIGGDPIGWLLGTRLGWMCLGLGLLLIVLGLMWSSRIASRTERLL